MAGSGELVMRPVPTWQVVTNEQQLWSLLRSESVQSKSTLIMDAENEPHPPALSLFLKELTGQSNDAISKSLGATSAGRSVECMQQNCHHQTTSEGLTDLSPDSLSKSRSSSADFSKTMPMLTENLASLDDSKPLVSSKVTCQYASDRSAFQGHVVDDKECLSKTSCTYESKNSALHEQGQLEVLPIGQSLSSVGQQIPLFKCGEELVRGMIDRTRTTEHLELEQNLETASYIGFQTGSGCLIKASAASMAKAKLLLEGNLDRLTVAESTINYAAKLGSFVKSDQKLSQEDSGKENVPNEMKFKGVDMKHTFEGSLHDLHVQMQKGSIYNKNGGEQFCMPSLNGKGETTMRSSQLKSITEEGPTSLFQTGSGKSVPVSSAAMKRARALLGEYSDTEVLSHPKHARFMSSFRKPRTLLQLQAPKNYVVSGSKSASTFFDMCLPSSLQVASRSNIAREKAVSFEINNRRNSILEKSHANLPRSRLSRTRTDSEMAHFTSDISLPVQECLFQTALGHPVRISASAMDRARHLLMENSESLHSSSTITDIRTSNVKEFHNGRDHFTSKQAKEFKVLPNIEDKTQISRSTSLMNMNNDMSNSSVQVPVRDFQKYKSYYAPGHSPVGAKRRGGPGKNFTLAFKHPRRRFSSPISNVPPDLNAQLSEVRIQAQLPIPNSEDGKQSCHSLLEVAPNNKISAESPSCVSSQFFESAAPMRMKLHAPHTPTWEQSVQLTSIESSQYHSHTDQLKGPHSKEVLLMTADSAKEYRLDCPLNVHKSGRVGPQEMRLLLLEAGLDKRNVTTEWVENHFRWIVWKLACQERRHGHQAAAKLLTFQRVLRELKHRYNREVNQGLRSALKKITEGDASAAQTMILCISAIRSIAEIKKRESSVQLGPRIMTEDKPCKLASNMSVPPAKIEVTDGWYSLNVVLDPLLTEQLRLGRLFVGQKVRVCGATLIGCLEPLPPLEAFNMATLVVHINGFHRAYRSERLGFCHPIPLAFRCIKDGGGIVLATYVGIRRVYPMLFRERLSDGHSVVRSSRAEDLAITRFEERQAYAIEDSLLKLQEGDLIKVYMSDEESDEGAQLNKALDMAGDPEIFMAEMTSAQHIALAIFQEKREASKLALIEKHVRKSLDESELVSRHVTAFMKIRVEGLHRPIGASGAIEATGPGKAECGKAKEGVITIWDANTDEVSEIEEGGLYCVTNLISRSEKCAGGSDNVLYLSTTKLTRWRRLFGQAYNTFQFSFCPRAPVMLSTLGEIAIGDEFDVAVTVIHVGEAFTCGVRKIQWLFTADGTLDIGMSNGSCQQHAILAIKFSWPLEASFPMDRSMTGSVVGFQSLIKVMRDCKNHFWVAQSTELSCFSSKLTSKSFSHLKDAINTVKLWAASSKPVLSSLYQRVQKVTGSVLQ